MAGLSRAQIRQTVARMLNDYYRAQATSDGGTGTFTDVYNLARETDHFKGMEVYFANPLSSHYGHIATVTHSDGPTRTISFEPPLPDSVVQGDVVELYNFKGRGSTITQYNASINDAIAVARELHALVPTVVTGTDPFLLTPGSLAIPDALESFSSVGFAMPDGRSEMARSGSYTVNRFTWTLDFKPRVSAAYHRRYPTFYGYSMAPFMNNETDETSIESEWLFNEVKAQILERLVASGMPIGDQSRIYLQERTEAGGKRPMIITRAMPNTVRRI